MADDLKIFISWSGELSRVVATEIYNGLTHLSDRFVPWMSNESISLGADNIQSIRDELQTTHVGIIVLTRENQHAEWINFEAGAISMKLAKEPRAVVPLLVDMDNFSEVRGPLRFHQGALFTKEKWIGLLEELSERADATGRLKRAVMRRYHDDEDRFWTAIESAKEASERVVTPSADELLRTILERIDELQRDSHVAGKAADMRREQDERMHSIAVEELIRAHLPGFDTRVTSSMKMERKGKMTRSIDVSHDPGKTPNDDQVATLRRALIEVGIDNLALTPEESEEEMRERLRPITSRILNIPPSPEVPLTN